MFFGGPLSFSSRPDLLRLVRFSGTVPARCFVPPESVRCLLRQQILWNHILVQSCVATPMESHSCKKGGGVGGMKYNFNFCWRREHAQNLHLRPSPIGSSLECPPAEKGGSGSAKKSERFLQRRRARDDCATHYGDSRCKRGGIGRNYVCCSAARTQGGVGWLLIQTPELACDLAR